MENEQPTAALKGSTLETQLTIMDALLKKLGSFEIYRRGHYNAWMTEDGECHYSREGEYAPDYGLIVAMRDIVDGKFTLVRSHQMEQGRRGYTADLEWGKNVFARFAAEGCLERDLQEAFHERKVGQEREENTPSYRREIAAGTRKATIDRFSSNQDSGMYRSPEAEAAVARTVRAIRETAKNIVQELNGPAGQAYEGQLKRVVEADLEAQRVKAAQQEEARVENAKAGIGNATARALMARVSKGLRAAVER